MNLFSTKTISICRLRQIPLPDGHYHKIPQNLQQIFYWATFKLSQISNFKDLASLTNISTSTTRHKYPATGLPKHNRNWLAAQWMTRRWCLASASCIFDTTIAPQGCVWRRMCTRARSSVRLYMWSMEHAQQPTRKFTLGIRQGRGRDDPGRLVGWLDGPAVVICGAGGKWNAGHGDEAWGEGRRVRGIL